MVAVQYARLVQIIKNSSQTDIAGVLVQSGRQLLNMDRVSNDDWNSKWSLLDDKFSALPQQMSHLKTNNDIISLVKPPDDARIDKLFLHIIYNWLPFSVGRVGSVPLYSRNVS